MSTTTSDEGAVAQPQAEAVESGDMIITTVNGAPEMVPAESVVAEEAPSPVDAPEAVNSEQEETQAPAETKELSTEEWAKSKNLPLDDPIKLAEMYRNAEKKMHKTAQQAKVTVPPPELLEESDDPTINAIVDRQNKVELVQYVNNWFRANPDLEQYRAELTKISQERPYLTDMDDVAAHLYRDPKFIEKLKSEGGKEALTNLAQKQSNIPPASAATNASEFSSSNITPQNVDALVAQHDEKWYEQNIDAINKAIGGA